MPNIPSDADISRIQQLRRSGVPRGYPAAADRLFADSSGVVLGDNGLYIPDGLWRAQRCGGSGRDTSIHSPDWSVGEGRAPLSFTKDWQSRGYDIDQHGLPLHPYWREFLHNPLIGWATGPGFFYKYGPNYTVDAVVYRYNPGLEVLLVRRQDCGKWALPGGFIDGSDSSPAAAARRELKEETGIAVVGLAERIGHFLSFGSRNTINSWCETVVHLFHPADNSELCRADPLSGSDASAAQWFDAKTAQGMALYSNHNVYLSSALANVRPCD